MSSSGSELGDFGSMSVISQNLDQWYPTPCGESFERDVTGRIVSIHTNYGYAHPNKLLGSPRANATYYVRENQNQHELGVRFLHIFRTDARGDVSSVEVPRIDTYPSRVAGKRFKGKACQPKSFPGGRTFDRGHLIACEFGGGMEAINLVTMPAAVNRDLRPSTAEELGCPEIASLAREYIRPGHHSRGTLTQSGEFALPNYRDFERVLKFLIRRGRCVNSQVGVRVRPITVCSRTSVLYAEIWADGVRIMRYKIDCDLVPRD